MARYRAPQHKLDHTPEYIDLSDDAWNQDLLTKAARREAWKDADGNVVDLAPLTRYALGENRYDLKAPDVQEVIAKTGCLDMAKAEVWTLRVLPHEARAQVFETYHAAELAQAQGAYSQAAHQERTANCLALLHGIVGLRLPYEDDAAKALVKAIEALPKERTGRDLEPLLKAFMDFRYESIKEIGTAIREVSADLREDERKN